MENSSNSNDGQEQPAGAVRADGHRDHGLLVTLEAAGHALNEEVEIRTRLAD